MFAAPAILRFHPRVERTGGWLKHWLQDMIGAGLAIMVGLGALTVRPFSAWFEAWSYDLPCALRSDAAVDGVVVVSMDAASRTALGQGEAGDWNRQLHANLLDRLIAKGARSVVFTTVFSEASSTNADQMFAQALRRARGKVVLAAGVTNGVVVKPVPELASAAPWGVLSAPSGHDEIIRRHGSLAGQPTLAGRVAQVQGKSFSSPSDSRWFQYYAPVFALKEVSYDEVRRGAEPPGVFKGEIVFVSSPAPDSERLPTPYTRWSGQRASRAEIEATAILNLTRREWLSRLPTAVETGIVIIAGGALGLAFMGMRRRTALLLAGGATLLMFGGAFLLFTQLQLWFPWLIVVGAQIPLAFGWSLLCEVVDRPRLPRRLPVPSTPGFAPATASIPMPTPTSPLGATPTAANANAPSIPDHTLLRCIGRGAYGEVWLVRDVIGRHQAVKIVKARSFPNAAPYEREFKGIERFASVSRHHPGLVQVLHIGRHDAGGYFFYIMELADDDSGATPMVPDKYSPKTLASELARRGHLPVHESVQIGLALCAALQHLHERQLVHRDIKPSNIIFVEGRVRIADIGLVAPITASANELTRLGTEGYLAPEGPGTPSADLYALGKVLYEISMGRDRWQFPEFPTTVGARPDHAELRRLHEIILTACDHEPAHRYPSAAEMHQALTRLLEPA